MRRIGLLLIVGVQVFLLQTVRLRERLTCSADPAASGLSCRRIIRRVLHSSDETFAIPDPGSVAFQVSGHTTSSHAYMNTSSINAVDNRGRTVVLLSIPGTDVAYAAGVEQQLRELGRTAPPHFVFERDEGRNAWLFATVVGAWWIAYFGLNHFRRVRARAAVDSEA